MSQSQYILYPSSSCIPLSIPVVPGMVSCSIVAAGGVAISKNAHSRYTLGSNVARGHVAFSSIGHVALHNLCCSCSLFLQVIAVSMLKGWMCFFNERKEDYDRITWLKKAHMQGTTEGGEAQPWHFSTENERGK